MPRRVIPIQLVAAARPMAQMVAQAALPLRVQPPLALYVHVPWCLRKCPYCDFNSHALPGAADLPEDAYLAALGADLVAALPEVWGRTVHSVFIGGGTPSLLSGAAVERLLSAVRALLPLSADCEITLEANPGAYEAGRYRAFRAAGVNRLSIGVQSFDDAKLRALGRVHDGRQAQHAVAAARADFDRINLDLMLGLPGQSPEQALADVRQALAYAPAHLSVYQLTLEPNTVFHKYPPLLPDEDTLDAIQLAVDQELAAAGYEHYEVSAYSRPGARARHNLNYWTFGDYLGIGAGAHGKLSLPDCVVRTERFRMPASYLEHAAAGRFESARRELSVADRVGEFMLNALRLRQGFPATLFTERTGLPYALLQPALHQAQARGLLLADHSAEHTGDRGAAWICPSPLGLRFLSDLQTLFLPVTPDYSGRTNS